MNELQLAFAFEELPVRTVTIGDTVWFVLKDVCDILEIRNPWNVYARLDDDEKCSIALRYYAKANRAKSAVSFDKLKRNGENDAAAVSPLQQSKTNLSKTEVSFCKLKRGESAGESQLRCYNAVNEPGLYDTIIRSNSERAKPFRRWITHEALPAIRKQGYYSLLSDEELIKVITEKQRQDRDFLDKIDKRAIKSQLLAERRQVRESETDLLFLRRREISCKRFKDELAAIWQDDSVMYHKHLDEYHKWYFKSGFKEVPPNEV